VEQSLKNYTITISALLLTIKNYFGREEKNKEKEKN